MATERRKSGEGSIYESVISTNLPPPLCPILGNRNRDVLEVITACYNGYVLPSVTHPGMPPNGLRIKSHSNLDAHQTWQSFWGTTKSDQRCSKHSFIRTRLRTNRRSRQWLKGGELDAERNSINFAKRLKYFAGYFIDDAKRKYL